VPKNQLQAQSLSFYLNFNVENDRAWSIPIRLLIFVSTLVFILAFDARFLVAA
jgi:hypothetical protein